jgi:CheY-like chemotaxis protein
MPSIPLKRLRILVVEDHADTRKLISRLVRDMGHSVITADCVESAMRVMESGPSEASPVDLVLSDLGLPDGSGLDLMRRIRQTRQDRRLKAIALTGHGMEEDVRRSREAGFDFHLTKPITVQALKDSINDVVREKVPDGAAPA